MTPPNCGAYTANARVDLDIAQARQLLADAGFPGGKGLPPFEVEVRSDGVLPSVMEAVQEMWLKQLGVHATLASLEQKTLLQNQQTLNYTVATGSWAADFIDPVTFLGLFVSGGGNNWTGWGDAEYDRMIDEAARTSNADARLAVFQRAAARLLDVGPVAPLYFGVHAYLIQPAVKGWAPAILGYHRYALVHLGDGGIGL
jgi:oligopeptide transport system substrate-binding protein